MSASNVPDEIFLTSGDVMREFGITYTEVAYWDNTSILKAAFRTVGGHRRFRQEDAARLRMNYPTRLRRADVRTEEIIRLRDAEKLTWKQIGAKFRMSRHGVRSRYYRARNDEPKPDGTHGGRDNSPPVRWP